MTLAQPLADFAPNWWLLGIIFVAAFALTVRFIWKAGGAVRNYEIEQQAEAVRRGVNRRRW